MADPVHAPLVEQERANLAFFLTLPEADRGKAKANFGQGIAVVEPLFEFSGACAGCGEAPYLKLASQDDMQDARGTIVRFYLACGFRATGTVDTRFGPGLAMQRALLVLG